MRKTNVEYRTLCLSMSFFHPRLFQFVNFDQISIYFVISSRRIHIISAIPMDKKEVGLIYRKILLHPKGITPMKQYQQLKKEERYYIWNALGTDLPTEKRSVFLLADQQALNLFFRTD